MLCEGNDFLDLAILPFWSWRSFYFEECWFIGWNTLFCRDNWNYIQIKGGNPSRKTASCNISHYKIIICNWLQSNKLIKRKYNHLIWTLYCCTGLVHARELIQAITKLLFVCHFDCVFFPKIKAFSLYQKECVNDELALPWRCYVGEFVKNPENGWNETQNRDDERRLWKWRGLTRTRAHFKITEIV